MYIIVNKLITTENVEKLSDNLPLSSVAHVGWLRRFRELYFLIVILVACYLALALYSYSLMDPRWVYWQWETEVSNQSGALGAWCSDFLYTVCGSIAWLVPVGLIISAIRIWLEIHHLIQKKIYFILSSILGFVFCIFAGAALISLYLPQMGESLPLGGGGWIGEKIVDEFLPIFGFHGSVMILSALGIVGITLYTRISWYVVVKQMACLSVFGKQVIIIVVQYIIWQILPFLILCLKKILLYGRKVFYRFWSFVSTLLIKIYKNFRVWLIHRKEYQKNKLHMQNKKYKTEENLAKKEEVLSFPVRSEVMPTNICHQVNDLALQSSNKKNMDSLGILLKPEISLLDQAAVKKKGMGSDEQLALSQLLEVRLSDFGVSATVESVNPGPVITRFEIQPAPGVKASRISGLASDLARAMKVTSVRVVEIIPGKSVIGIEVPNKNRDTVYFSDVVGTDIYKDEKSPLSLVLGQDTEGQPIVVDLARMPHLLVAGTTGSGKSVGVNAMLLSMLFKADPEEVRMIMIDPKMLELSVYDGIPHLLTPVVTDMKEASGALRWCVMEMERRYRLMAAIGVRHISGFNQKLEEGVQKGTPLRDPLYKGVSINDEAPELGILPFIVVIIDEFADMMMIVGKKVEESIARIAQKARAAGIHMILATQRPSVDVITGLIKANIPTRISFQVSSKIDSRTILDQGGAEQLLGQGDMLYLPAGVSVPMRVHGAFVSDDEVHRVVSDWKEKAPPNYIDNIIISPDNADRDVEESDVEQDALYDEVVAFVVKNRKASISGVQRQFRIGYNRSARIIEAMEVAGIIGVAGSSGLREVLVPKSPQ